MEPATALDWRFTRRQDSAHSTWSCSNEVVTVEPGLYDPAIGGIRIEDLVVVTKAGHRNLTEFPKTFEI